MFFVSTSVWCCFVFLLIAGVSADVWLGVASNLSKSSYCPLSSLTLIVILKIQKKKKWISALEYEFKVKILNREAFSEKPFPCDLN